MTSREENRHLWVTQLLPQVDEAERLEGFHLASSPKDMWQWDRVQAEGIRARVALSEMTGRHTRDGIDLTGSGALIIAEVEERVSAVSERPSEAATLIAPLRSWGLTHTRDNRYPLRWSTDPAARVTELCRDLRAFAQFAAGIASVRDLAPHKLAVSRIRRHVVDGLAPNYARADVADIISELALRD